MQDFNLEKNWPIVLIAVVVLFLFLKSQKTTEGYSSKTPFLAPELDQYYIWRALGPNNACEANSYPWNRRNRPHFARFNYFYPGFYEGGHGHL